MNLIRDAWIPVRRASGAETRIAPWQVTERLDDDPVLVVASPRADFDGALVQLLIGLLQGALTPDTPGDWRQRFDTPPSPEELESALASWAPYFELLGDGPRFLQDLELERSESAENGIEKLLIDCGLSGSSAHFVKEGRIHRLCRPCTASALLTLMTNAPSGGRGHRTGLRGGGPLTTLVRHEASLWATLWLNVLERGELESVSGNPARDRPEDRFPWLAATRTSEKGTGQDTTAEDVHPLQMYFGLPRRIRLLEGEDASEGALCDLCAEPAPDGIARYFTRPSGVRYTGAWEHPLSPHRKTKDNTLLPLHGSASDLPYTEWLGLVQSDEERGRHPAWVVRAITTSHRARRAKELRLWAFGYDMDNMKPRAWCEGTMPLYLADPDYRKKYERKVAQLVRAARLAARYLEKALVQALSRRGKGSPPPEARAQFLQITEGDFYQSLPQILEHLERDEDTLSMRQGWRHRLVEAAEQVFDTYSQSGLFRDADPRLIARAHNTMRRNLYGKKLRELLELPKKPNST